MRKIGECSAEKSQFLAEVLAGAGIGYQCDELYDGQVEFWAIEDEQQRRGKALFQEVMSAESTPALLKLQKEGQQAQKQQRVESIKRDIEEKKHRIVYSGRSTVASKWMMGISALLFVLSMVQPTLASEVKLWMLIWDPRSIPWQSLLDGQLWRLLTPMFLHFGILHVLFNCWWMWDLGRMVESRLGTLRFIALVAFISVPAHLGQAFLVGPMFGGLSGVVYGLLGYVWWRSRRDPRCGLELHPQTMMFMMIWLVMGFLVFKNVANVVHVMGLVMGLGAAHWHSRAKR